ncbi:PAS domain S-box protein [Mastigocoleus testarum]|uniref:histidine kinase n=1 Tax=Mastigocoleus testarum BC008 TaxID=371196 RepID=A0A0V7ZLH6_9CYAN|nr:PAS domain S-box protein [Mastigocoleus testarum]KST65405.1 hypothetical protein BC008_21680 [Mastigocoleus testarum BC008]KST70469.1 hypothetical protein BC008_45630 [Mastigocoleus testarum BC008]
MLTTVANLFLFICTLLYFALKIKRSATALNLQPTQESDAPNDRVFQETEISVADLHQFFSKYLGETSDAIAVIDTEYKFIAANSRMQQDFEQLFARKHQLGVNVLDLLAHIPKRQNLAATYWGRALSGESFSITEEFIATNSKKRYYEMKFSPIRDKANNVNAALMIAREITESVDVQMRLRDNEAKLLAAQKVARVGTWEFDVATYKSTLSEEIYRICGLEPNESEISYVELLFLIHPQDCFRVKELIERAIFNGIYEEIELRVRRPDGSIRHVLSRGEVIKDERGEVVKIFSANVDITERKQTEEALLCAQDELEMQVQQRTAQLRHTNEVLRTEIRERNLSEKALRESEARFRHIFESNMIGIGMWSGEKIIDGNSALCKLLGYEPEEFHSGLISWREITPTEYREADNRSIAEVKANGFLNSFEKEYFRKDGSRVSVVIGGCSIGDNSSRGFFFVLDNTWRKQAEVELRESEERFRATFEQAAVGIAHIASDGRWLRANQKICEIIGYSRAELLSKTFQDVTYPDDLKADLECFQQTLRGEIPSYSIEKRYIRQYGGVVWGNLTVSLVRNAIGEPKYFISVLEDITSRKQLEAALRKSIQRLRNLHELDRGVIKQQKPNEIAAIAIHKLGQILPCARVTINTFDIKAQTAKILMTKGTGEHIAGTGYEIELQALSNIIQKLQQDENDYVTGNLSMIPASSQIQNLRSEGLYNFLSFPLRIGDDLLGTLNLWLDDSQVLTHEELDIACEVCDQVAIAVYQARLYQEIQHYTKKLEQRVAERTAQLEEVNQELEAFTYTVSHDLRAPLRALEGFATAILEDYAENLDDLGIEYAQRLVDSARQMDKLIQDLLAYSRLSRADLHLGPTRLSQIVAQAVDSLEAEIEEKQAQITVCKALGEVYGSSIVLTQVISNLISNAIKFVAPHKQPAIRIWSEERNNKVRLWVEDKGIGISKRHQEQIFHVFERLHGSETYPGTGIGLAIVSKGMERLGGCAGVESELGQGSRFWIEAPNRVFIPKE